MILHSFFLRFLFGSFAFIMIRLFRVERERGAGLGKVLKPGFELKTAIAHSTVAHTAHPAIGNDKNLKVLIKCYLSTDQRTGQQISSVHLASSAGTKIRFNSVTFYKWTGLKNNCFMNWTSLQWFTFVSESFDSGIALLIWSNGEGFLYLLFTYTDMIL